MTMKAETNPGAVQEKSNLLPPAVPVDISLAVRDLACNYPPSSEGSYHTAIELTLPSPGNVRLTLSKGLYDATDCYKML